MLHPNKSTLLASVIVVGLLASRACGQAGYTPVSDPQRWPTAATMPSGGWATPFAYAQTLGGAGWQAPAQANPYYAGNPYVSYPDPYGGYLQGAASVISAQSQFMKDYETSRIIREQFRSAKIDNRRKMFDERLYEQANTPNEEDIREHDRVRNLRRALNDPPLPEIRSGKALNDLMTNILRQESSTGNPGPAVPLDERMLRRINVSTGAGESSTGVLRSNVARKWPTALQGEDLDEQRKQFTKLIGTATEQVEQGQQADPSVITELTVALTGMRDGLRRNVNKITANDYVQARHYLLDLKKTVETLQDPNAANYISGRWAARGRTVSELCQNMSQQGLRFAPANSGDEAAYTSLQRSMASYLMGTPVFATQTQFQSRGIVPGRPEGTLRQQQP